MFGGGMGAPDRGKSEIKDTAGHEIDDRRWEEREKR